MKTVLNENNCNFNACGDTGTCNINIDINTTFQEILEIYFCLSEKTDRVKPLYTESYMKRL